MTQEDLIQDITYLAHINSGSYHSEGCLKTLQEMEKMLAPICDHISYHQGLDAIHLCDDGRQINLNFAPTLHGIIHPEAKKRVCLFGHADTVFPPESPFQTVRRDQKYLYGPGVSDMKGGIVMMIAALKQFLEENPQPHIGFDIVINSDEEVGSVSSEAYFLKICPKITVALGYEPALACGNFAGTRKGGITFSVAARGISAHAGRAFDQGKNAVAALGRLNVFCDDLWRNYDGLSINVGYFSGGGAVNIVPDLAIMRVNMRSNHFSDLEDAINKIYQKAQKLQETYGVVFEIFERNRKNPKKTFHAQEKLQNIVAELCLKDQMPHQFIPTGGMCDGNIFSGQNIPTIDTLGAVGGKIHTINEFLDISQIENRVNLSRNLFKILNQTNCLDL